MEELECEEALDDALDEESAVALAALQASPLVHAVRPITGARGGWYATLWCQCEHPGRKSEQVQFSLTRTTDAACLETLLETIERKHAAHLAAAVRAAAAAEAAAAAGSSAPTSAFAAMAAAAQRST